MLKKRIIVCLDVRDGKVTKGIKFKNNKIIGNPVELAIEYYRQGVDELVFYDITASIEQRNIMIDIVREVANNIFIPFSVGGGIKNVEDINRLLLNGAEKISLNSFAVQNPDIIDRGVKQFGSQCIVLGMDVLADIRMPSGYRVLIKGGQETTNLDALSWAKEAVDRGVGEIVINSIDADGTQQGYDCVITHKISHEVLVPVVASGGGGKPEHLVQVLQKGGAQAVLIASMVHYGTYTLQEIKQFLSNNGIEVRLDY